MSKFKLWLFRLIFTAREEQIIINALYHRSKEVGTYDTNEEKDIRHYCKYLADTLMGK